MASIKKIDAEDTKEKISEVRYFFDKMVKNQNDANPFKYNLSAFLVAFRSIRDFMERVEDPKLDVCFAQLTKWMDNDAQIILLRKEGNVTTHERIISKHNDVAANVATVTAEARASPKIPTTLASCGCNIM